MKYMILLNNTIVIMNHHLIKFIKIYLLKDLNKNKNIHVKEEYQYINETQTNNNINNLINSNQNIHNEGLFRDIEYKIALENLKEGINVEKCQNEEGITLNNKINKLFIRYKINKTSDNKYSWPVGVFHLNHRYYISTLIKNFINDKYDNIYIIIVII